MRLTLDDPKLLLDLLRFLREADCIAYLNVDDLSLRALRPEAFGASEERQLRELVRRWQRLHPQAHVGMPAA